ncbi:LicD family protein [Planctobacterium marinum]|uniref:LicD/FKTN/FKRP nucleotidyltransferase domain-containing protein n=1 Tax=Planctobacterium marinum TaxID=1631968 RepID=A0AA48HN09_9ALTE|nr:hypothetical protein MACH26_33020 [Planctobacterium marinum]
MKQSGIIEAPPRVLIFGAGLSGLSAWKNLKQAHQVLGFIDNDANKQGKTYCELPVFAPEQLNELCFEVIFIASEYIENIKAQLLEDARIPAEKVKTLPSYMTKPMQFGEQKGSIEAGEQVLCWLCQMFNDVEVQYFLDAGTLLGIVRDGALIPWDDDLDIGIPLRELDRVYSLLENHLCELEQCTGIAWRVDQVLSEHQFGVIKPGDVRSLKLSPKLGGQECELAFPMVDLFVKYPNGNTADYALASRGISMPIEHFQTTDLIQFSGIAMKTPANPELYLERYYGDWKTPQKEWDVGMISSASSF